VNHPHIGGDGRFRRFQRRPDGARAGKLSVTGNATTIGALHQLVPQFEKQTGDVVHLMLGNPGKTIERLRHAVDVVICSGIVWEMATKECWIGRRRAPPAGPRSGRARRGIRDLDIRN
jgi:hypothetical protein